MVKNYDPNLVTVICGAKIIQGFGDGTIIQVERNEQAFTLKVGVTGEACRARSRNRSAKVTLTLLQSSSSNDDLSDFALLDETTGAGTFPFLLKDADGTTLVSAVTAWVQKFPNAEYAKDVSQREWVIETDELLMYVGGNVVAG